MCMLLIWYAGLRRHARWLIGPLSAGVVPPIRGSNPTPRWQEVFARIGIMRALNRNVERVFNPDRKDKHWGKRKLKREQ